MEKMLKFAAPFQLKNKLKENESYIDEYNLEYNPDRAKINSLDSIIDEISDGKREDSIYKNLTFIAMVDFLNEYPDKRINIKFKSGIDIKTAKAFRKVSKNVYFRLGPQEILAAKSLSEEKIPFFFDSTLGIGDYNNLQGVINSYNISDIYIVDDLWYNLEEVSKYCHKNNVSIRLILNRIPSTSLLKGKIETTPIFRPNDFTLLSKYIDVGEFDCGNPYNFNKEKVLYDTWYNKHQWFGNLQEINQDLMFPIYNRSLIPDFVNPRIKCNLGCVSRNSSCTQCEQFIDISKMLASKNIALKEK